MTKVIYMDISRCIYCRACEVACEREHAGRSNMFVQLIGERHAVPINCRHCEKSPCIQVCPTGALQRAGDDALTIATMQCIGCNLCALACPFGAIWFDRLDKVARKCDLCLHRTSQGLEPACVTTCSARALVYGEIDDFISEAGQNGHRLVISRAAGKTGTVVAIPSKWEALFPQEPQDGDYAHP